MLLGKRSLCILGCALYPQRFVIIRFLTTLVTHDSQNLLIYSTKLVLFNMVLPRLSHGALLLNRDEKPNYEQHSCLPTYHPLLIFEVFLLRERPEMIQKKIYKKNMLTHRLKFMSNVYHIVVWYVDHWPIFCVNNRRVGWLIRVTFVGWIGWICIGHSLKRKCVCYVLMMYVIEYWYYIVWWLSKIRKWYVYQLFLKYYVIWF